MILIDHEMYGEASTFATLEEAQAAIRECGSDFARTKFRICGGDVYDETDEAVGEVLD